MLSLPAWQIFTELFCSLRVIFLTGPDGGQPTCKVKEPSIRPELKPYQSLKAIFCPFCWCNPKIVIWGHIAATLCVRVMLMCQEWMPLLLLITCLSAHLKRPERLNLAFQMCDLAATLQQACISPALWGLPAQRKVFLELNDIRDHFKMINQLKCVKFCWLSVANWVQ